MADASPREGAHKARTQAETGRSADGTVLLGKTIRINPREPLPYLDQGEIKAFSAIESKGDGEVSCYAQICLPGLIPRRNGSTIYKNISDPGLAGLKGSGVVYWPPASAQRYVFVYENSAERSVLSDPAQLCAGWRQERTMDIVFASLYKALAAMKKQSFFHGLITPANLFTIRGQSKGVVLGGPLAAPAGCYQSIFCETIDRGLAETVGRGPGQASDDMYAFGATLALMIREPDPELKAMSREAVIRAKFEEGSYAFLVGKERLSAPVQDLLKGLLSDDPQQRWNIDDVAVWVGGKRPPSHPAQRRRKGSRGLNFAGKNHFYVPSLALVSGSNPEQFARVVEDGQVEEWLMRSLDDKETIERYEIAVKHFKSLGRDRNYSHLITACVRSSFIPEWPVYYRDRSISYSGFDTALADAFEKSDDLNIFHELIEKGIIINQLHMLEAKSLVVSGPLKQFEECRQALKQTRAGFGLERCLYLLNRNVNCLSPRLKGFYVFSAQDLIYALEAVAAHNKSGGLFLDRQSIAFLCEVDARCVDGYLYELNSPDKSKQVMGNLKCLAEIQKRYKISALPNLSQAFLEFMSPVFERFHDRSIRDNVVSQVTSAARSGDLSGMAAALDNRDMQNRDMANFKRAMLEYYNLSLEHQQLSAQMQNKGGFGRADAHMISAMVSGIIGFLLILFSIVSFFSERGLPGF
ncbi:MAG: hypothetical protein KDI90_10120 [Alphaproteobacteria bacterium]|nr:hypothetical protein [Alphaproteobacteria bacterium]MCB9975749.1 hypothetical protein [Rhodospirillales bacterium]